MATACETVVLGGVRELPLRVGFASLSALGRVGGYGVTGARGFSRAAAGEATAGGGGATTTALQAKTAHRRPRIQNQKSMAVGLRGHINVRGAVAACRWVPGCRAVHWPTRCDDKGRGWMQY